MIPEIIGIDNVIKTYKDSVQKVRFSGPTYLAPILNEFRLFVESTIGRKTYSVLLMLIDGSNHDLPKAKDEMIKLAKLPCSVINVFIGDGDPCILEELKDAVIKNDKEVF